MKKIIIVLMILFVGISFAAVVENTQNQIVMSQSETAKFEIKVTNTENIAGLYNISINTSGAFSASFDKNTFTLPAGAGWGKEYITMTLSTNFPDIGIYNFMLSVTNVEHPEKQNTSI